jgi:hypothetical protein
MLGASALAAQQPGPPKQPPQQPEHRQQAAMSDRASMAEQTRMMDSLNNRLDSLVARMNRVTGSAKVAAIADVINELVAQRKAMQERMREMMGRREGMMGMMDDSGPGSPGRPGPKVDSGTADTAGHADHHPPR